MFSLPLALQLAVVLVVVSAAVYDFKYRRIPNWLNLSGLVLGFGLNILFFQLSGMLLAGRGLLLALAIYLPLYMLRGMGAGDVKLMIALGSLVGPWPWFEIFVATAILGGLAAGVLALSKSRFNETCTNLYGILQDLLHLRLPYRSNPKLDIRDPRALRMPHGVSIAIGALAVLGAEIWQRRSFLP